MKSQPIHVELPFPPTEVLLEGVGQGLSLLGQIFMGLPGWVQAVVVAAVAIRLIGFGSGSH